MLIATVVLVLVASVALAVALCFVQKQSPFFGVLKCLFLASLVCVGICCASYKNAFNGYSILLILSVLPLFFTLFQFKEKAENAQGPNFDKKFDEKEDNFSINSFENAENEEKNLNENVQISGDFPAENAKEFAKNDKKILAPNWTKILQGMAYAVSAFCIAFCALYLGKETPYAFFAGLFLGLGWTFLHFIVKKRSLKNDPWGFCADFLFFLAVGFLLCAILPTLLYSFALDNILFSIACVTFCAHLLLEIYLPNKFKHLLLALSMFLLFATIVF